MVLIAISCQFNKSTTIVKTFIIYFIEGKKSFSTECKIHPHPTYKAFNAKCELVYGYPLHELD